MSVLSAATGKDASHNAGQAQQQSQAYQKQAAPLYSGLASQGANLTSLFNSQFPGLLSMFEGAAGLPNTVGPTGTPLGGQTGATGQPGATAAPSAAGNTAAGGKAPTPGATQTANNLMASVPANLQQYAANNPTFNPYQLNPDAQAYLSAQLQQMDTATQASIGTYQSQLASMGIQDSSSATAGASWIRQQADAKKNQFVSGFMLEQQQQEEQAAASLLSSIIGLGGQGAQETQAGAGGLASLGSQNQQASIQQEQISAGQMAGVGSFLGNLAFPGVGSLFGGSGGGTGNANGNLPVGDLSSGLAIPIG